ncbi:MAG: hypothetical protein WCP63_14160, partial [Cyanobium sp. ELA712]
AANAAAVRSAPNRSPASGASGGGGQRRQSWRQAGSVAALVAAVLRSRPDPRLQPPDPLPPDPPERALQRLGPLELPKTPPDWQERLAEKDRKLVGEE